MSTYFNYDILYAMNVTDVDDKIIFGARKAHLLKEYRSKATDKECVLSDMEKCIEVCSTYE